ncbi:urease accessory protein UreD [Desulfolithobacter sp.]
MLAEKRVETGWQARLELTCGPGLDRTVLLRTHRLGPLTVQRPFYPEDGVCHTYILHPPGGVVGGDVLDLRVKVESGGAALLTTPGATKLYRSVLNTARVRQRFQVSEGGCLEWMPQENIVFPGARAELLTRIDLQGSAQFLGWEILCLGRPVIDEQFHSGTLLAGLELYRDGKPLVLEKLRVAGKEDLQRRPGLRSLPVTATMLAVGVGEELLESLRQKQETVEGAFTGMTLLDGVLVARYLGSSPEEARRFFIGIWEGLRPSLLDRNICLPRIWAT